MPYKRRWFHPRLGRPHMPRGSWAHVPQSMSPCPGTLQPQLLSPYAAAAEARALQGLCSAMTVLEFHIGLWIHRGCLAIYPGDSLEFLKVGCKRGVLKNSEQGGCQFRQDPAPPRASPEGTAAPPWGTPCPPYCIHTWCGCCRFHSYGPPSFRLQDLGEEKYVLLHFCNSYTIKHLASVFVCMSVIYIYLFVYVFVYIPIFIEL